MLSSNIRCVYAKTLASNIVGRCDAKNHSSCPRSVASASMPSSASCMMSASITSFDAVALMSSDSAAFFNWYRMVFCTKILLEHGSMYNRFTTAELPGDRYS